MTCWTTVPGHARRGCAVTGRVVDAVADEPGCAGDVKVEKAEGESVGGHGGEGGEKCVEGGEQG